MRGIFISYRREDTEGHAGRLYEDLAGEFGKETVFMDVVAIEPGRDFRRVIDQQVASCGVLLAMIGKSWTDAKDDAGRRRLEEVGDFVRLEIAAALKRDIPVVPVLVHGAGMPRADQLPPDLAELAYRNGVELTHARWESDVQVLIRALRPYVDGAAAPRGAGSDSPAAGVSPQPAKAATVAPSAVIAAGSQTQPATASSRGLIVAGVAALAVAGGLGAYFLTPSRVAVPNLVGIPIDSARAALAVQHLAPGSTERKPDTKQAAGTVLEQSPPAGDEVKTGTRVNLAVAALPASPTVRPLPAPQPGGFTDWMPAGDFAKARESQPPGRQFPAAIEGREQDGRLQLRARFDAPPEGTAGSIFTWGMAQDKYDEKAAEMKAKGFTEYFRHSFVGASGVPRYQSVWVKLKDATRSAGQ